MKLYCDLETFAETPISAGSYRYAEGAEIMLFAYAIDDAEPRVWDVTTGEPIPAELHRALLAPNVMTVWHNGAGFDRHVLREALGIDLPISRIHDTMVQALSHSLPGGLAILCDILKVPQDSAKLSDGKRLVNKFCKPLPSHYKLERATRLTHPEDWERFKQYAANDILAMREVLKRLPAWNYPTLESERELFELDQKINDRGIHIDIDLAHAAVRAVKRAQEGLSARTQEITMGAVSSTSQRDALIEWVSEQYDVKLPNLQGSTVEKLLAEATLPEPVLELLRIRAQASASSTAKYLKFLETTGTDFRLRGMLQYCGASRTGRWTGRLVQLQNLPRQNMGPDEIETGIEAMKADCEDLMYDDVMGLASESIRGCIAAPEGRKLVAADLANIEGRVLAWIAGEHWKLDAFREFDEGRGADLYKVAYARAFGIDISEVTKPQRQVGKVLELACFAADTLVLTKQDGYIPIVKVTPAHLIWDGVEWTHQQGLIEKGVRPVVLVADTVWSTEDHLVLTQQTWRPVSELVSNKSTLTQALETGSANLPLSELTARDKVVWSTKSTKCNVAAALTHTLSHLQTSVREGLHAVASALKKNLIGSEKCITDTTTLSLTPSIEGVCLIGYPPRLTGATALVTKGITAMEVEASKYTRGGKRIKQVFYNTLLRWMGGITRIWTWIGLTLTAITSRATSVLFPSLKIAGVIREPSGRCKKKTTSYAPVYDLLNCGSRNRFTILTKQGPLIVHNCGYQGGVGAFHTFATAYALDLEDLAVRAYDTIPKEVIEQSTKWREKAREKKMPSFGLSNKAWIVCDALKSVWRRAHPGISGLWTSLDQAITTAVCNPGQRVNVGYLVLRRDGNWLRIKLPSGRCLSYPAIRLDEEKGEISYVGMNQYTRRWERVSSYGGKWAENITQAIARDVLAHGMALAERHDYQIVLTVHDEIVCETPANAEFSHHTLAQLMATVPDWAQGLPLAAEGFEGNRYRK